MTGSGGDGSTSSTDAVRVIVVGTGLIGRQRATALQAIDGALLVGTVDPSPDAWTVDGVPHAATVEGLPKGSYDAAVVAVPHHAAFALVSQLLESGTPILVEKPLGKTPTEARTLCELASRLDRPSFVGYNYRYLPAVEALSHTIRDGSLGRLRSIDMLIGHGGHPGSAEGWKLDPALAGGGVLLDPGVHLLDLLLMLAPPLDCVSVEATRGFWGTGVEEDVALTFRSADLLATLRISHIRWVNLFRIEVFGDDGYAIVEGRGGNYGEMTLREGRRWAWAGSDGIGQRDTEEVTSYGSRDESLRVELEHIVGAWRSGVSSGDTPHPATLPEGLAVADLCETLYGRMT